MKVDVLDNPTLNDNRNYNYSGFESIVRKEYEVITDWVESNSSVIDLACGNGTLLGKLIKEKNISGKGVELSDSGIEICKVKNLDVIKGSIDHRLPFQENEFDYAVCNVTIQMVMYPEVLLSEMKRISKKLIVSFPNFAYYKNRLDLLLKGRMPMPMLFDYKWYNTGHIHQFSISDFFALLNEIGGLKVKETKFAKTNSILKNSLIKTFPNLFMPIPIFYIEKVS